MQKKKDEMVWASTLLVTVKELHLLLTRLIAKWFHLVACLVERFDTWSND
jgi:hypothetical protein